MIKKLLLGVIALVVIVVGIGFVLPSKYHVERSIEIAAAPEKVYAHIVSTRAWKSWTVWNQRDPNMKLDYAGPESGVGAKWSWESKSEGSGLMEFTAAEPNKRLEYRLEFPEFNSVSTGALTLEPAGSGTKVTWTNDGDMGGNPLLRYMALAMDSMVGKDFAAGLANLKQLAEAGG